MAKRPEKLGRLVVGPPREPAGRAAPPPDPPRRAFPLWLVCTLGVVAVGLGVVGWQSGWLPAQFTPRKIVVRGAELGTSAEVLNLIDASAGSSYLQWWRAARAVEPGSSRWLNGVAAAPLPGRGLLLEVSERQPVLRVESAGAGYWLCGDGTIEKAQLDDHKQDLFKRIKALPVARLDGLALADVPRHAADLLSIAANCDEALKGQISIIAINAQGEFNLYERSGLEIRLGAPVGHEVKIAALPKALRTANADRKRIAYLDGRGRVQGSKFVFYEVVKEEGV